MSVLLNKEDWEASLNAVFLNQEVFAISALCSSSRQFPRLQVCTITPKSNGQMSQGFSLILYIPPTSALQALYAWTDLHTFVSHSSTHKPKFYYHMIKTPPLWCGKILFQYLGTGKPHQNKNSTLRLPSVHRKSGTRTHCVDLASLLQLHIRISRLPQMNI